MSVNKASYIHLIILLFDKISNNIEISRHYNILKTKAKLVVFLLFALPQNSDGPPNVSECIFFIHTNSGPTL